MRTSLSIKRDISRNLKANQVKYVLCPSTGIIKIGSAVLSIDSENGYVIADIPTEFPRRIKFQQYYQGFALWFARFAELYEAHPHRSYLLPIVVYPKPQMSKRKAIKPASQALKVHAA